MLQSPKGVRVGFDLDGTLVDSSQDIRASLKKVLSEFELDTDIAQCVKIGPPFRQMVEPHLPRSFDRLGDLYASFRRTYDFSGFPNSTLYPGALDILNWCRSSEIKLFLATNKPRFATSQLLKNLRIERYFDIVQNPDMDPSKQISKIGMLEKSRELFADQIIYFVGDSIDDVKAAKLNGCKSIAVSYGYTSVELLSQAAPDMLIHHLSELKSIILKEKHEPQEQN